MKRHVIATAFISATLAFGLAGCGTPTETDSTAGSDPRPSVVEMATATPTPFPTPILFEWVEFPPFPEGVPLTDAQGYLVKDVGVPAGMGLDDGTVLMKWLVRGVTVDPECTNPGAQAPANGHFVRIDIQGEAYPELAAAYEHGGWSGELFLQQWEATDTNGVLTNGQTVTPQSISCLTPAEQVDVNIQPGQRSVGSVVLDLPITEGTISIIVNSDTGFTYPLR